MVWDNVFLTLFYRACACPAFVFADFDYQPRDQYASYEF